MGGKSRRGCYRNVRGVSKSPPPARRVACLTFHLPPFVRRRAQSDEIARHEVGWREMQVLIQIVLALVALWLISGTLLNFSKHPHWYIRGWDFPRVFTAIVAAAVGVVYAIFFHVRWWDWALLAGLAFVV